jgi:hypothetical protein
MFLMPSPAAAGAWPVKPGAGKATVGASFLTAGSVSDAAGDKRSYGMTETGLSTYGEAGLVRRLSIGWAWGFLKFVESDSADRAGITDPEISLTWHLGRAGGAVFALQGLTQLPWGPDNPGAVPDFAPAFHSHGAYAFELRPLVGYARARWWTQAGVGVRARTGDLAWQFRYAVAAGRAFGPRWSGMLALDGVTPLDTETSGRVGDQEQYFGSHLAAEFRVSPPLQLGAQFDSMFSLGQEMPLGGRINVYARASWR